MTTKEFARNLGILRKRVTPTSAFLKQKTKPTVTGQELSYLVVLDFESTCWKERTYYTQEIIEFPAVLCNTQTGQIESEFHHYVQPQEQPILSAFCKELTGITQADVENGIPLSLCLRKFSHWLQQLIQNKHISFSAPKTQACKQAAFVTWSDWDLGTCLLYETKRKQLSRPQEMNSWIDLRATYRKFYGRKPNGLNGALQDVGITFEGREHSGLCDARNTASLAWRMIRDGCIMQITKDISSGLAKPIHTPRVVRDGPDQLGQTPSPCRKIAASSSKSSPSKLPRPKGLHIRSNGDIMNNTKKLLSPCLQNSTSVNCVKDDGISNTNNSINNIVFPTPNKIETKQSKPTFLTTNGNKSVYSMFKTPSPAQASRVSTLMKATSPLCKCGRRSKRRLVQSPGPNVGRFFFVCGVNTSPVVGNRGCEFFLWENQSTSGARHRSARGELRTRTKPYAGGARSAQCKNSSLIPSSHGLR